jgi:hypothetical protein
MEPATEPIITPKKIIELLKVLGYSLVFSVLLLAIILAVVSKNINISKIFTSQDSKAEFLKELKALPIKK